MDARTWLRENGYEEVAEMIDEIMAEWRASGKKTRRNWWEILAGRKDGGGRTVAGRVFPLLRSVQLRQGLEPSSDSILRSASEEPPKKEAQIRWLGARTSDGDEE